MTNPTYIQFTETFKTAFCAEEALKELLKQVGCVGGRLYETTKNTTKPVHIVQVFFKDDASEEKWLPDGCRRVRIPDFLKDKLLLVRPKMNG